MNSWNEGYFTDSTYTYGYYRELSPNFMRWCLLVNGIAAPEITEKSCHCELGYGQGVSANIHAAATAEKYFGTDFNPAHAAQANELAEASGADAKFFEDSFEEFSKRDDPQFDSVGFHGIWTWVSAENRRHMLKVARQHLKSGGMVYNSYNCLPGRAPNAPLRELLSICDRYKIYGGNDINERVASAFKFVEEVIAAEPAYAMVAPSFKTYFELIKKYNANYIAHEYLNLDWDLMYFADVAELCQSAKLDFATVAFPAETGTAYLSEKGQEFFKKFNNPILFEQLKDYFINRRFRKDIYVRGVRRLSSTEVYDKVFSMRYVLMTPAAEVPMTMTFNGRELALTEEIYRPVFEYFQEDNFRPKDLREYFLRGKSNAKLLLEVLRMLVQAAHISPCQSDTAAKRAKKFCERLNAHICERSAYKEAINFLASPLTGGGVEVARFYQIFLAQHKACNKTAHKLAEAAWKIISRNGERMMDENKKVFQTKEENLAHLKTLAERFLARLPIYKALML